MTMYRVRVVRLRNSGAWKLPFSSRELEELLAVMLDSSGLPRETELELTLAGDAEMGQLNARHLGCQGPTNVLSFPAKHGPFSGPGHSSPPTPETPPQHLGSLVLAPDTALRESALYWQYPETHCLRLLAHGLAHLLGHDHGPEMDALADAMLQAAEAQRTLAWNDDRLHASALPAF